VTVADALLATPVPPEAGDKVADKPAAVPVVFWLKVGQSKCAGAEVARSRRCQAKVSPKLGYVDQHHRACACAKCVTPVPPLATGKVPVTPVVKGKPVKFVSRAACGCAQDGGYQELGL